MDEMSVRLDDGTNSGEASFFGHCPSVFKGSFIHPALGEASLFLYYMLDDGTDSGEASFFEHCLSGFRGSFIRPASGEASSIRLGGKLHCSFTICNDERAKGVDL
jgi:hypothetical protein